MSKKGVLSTTGSQTHTQQRRVRTVQHPAVVCESECHHGHHQQHLRQTYMQKAITSQQACTKYRDKGTAVLPHGHMFHNSLLWDHNN